MDVRLFSLCRPTWTSCPERLSAMAAPRPARPAPTTTTLSGIGVLAGRLRIFSFPSQFEGIGAFYAGLQCY